MAIASLLNPAGTSFAFDHNELHREMLAAAPISTSGASIDPMTDVQVPAGWWNSLHAQLHEDFAVSFPAILWQSVSPINDVALAQGADPWWDFGNMQLHNIARSVLPSVTE